MRTEYVVKISVEGSEHTSRDVEHAVDELIDLGWESLTELRRQYEEGGADTRHMEMVVSMEPEVVFK